MDYTPPQTPRKQDNLAAFEHALSSIEGASNKRNSLRERSRTLSAANFGNIQNKDEQLEKVLNMLEEREKEVVLAAEIGKVLVDRNKEFEAKHEVLTEKLKQEAQRANDLQQAIDTLEQENSVLREIQGNGDEVDKLEKKNNRT